MSDDMLEFVFFHKVLAEKFIKKIESYQIKAKLIKEDPAWEVHVPEDIDDSIDEELNDYYDELFADDQEMYESSNAEDSDYNAAGIEINLQDGTKIMAETDQKLLGKVLSTITFDEFNQLVHDIASAVENPDERSICQRYRDLNTKL